MNHIKVFDCTLREIGYQTGWFFTSDFVQAIYKFALDKEIDYVELGFFHNEKADSGRGYFRYCSQYNDEIRNIFQGIKSVTKLSAMRDIQRPLSPLLHQKDTVIDTIRILTRSHETDLKVLGTHIEEIMDLGYEVFVNFTSAGFNTIEKNKKFAKFLKSMGVKSVEFADTESIMTESYVMDTIKICHEEGLKVGVHLHNKNGMADPLADIAIMNKADYIDVTHLGLGGKWRDGNLTMEYLLKKNNIPVGYEATVIKNQVIEQLINFKKYSVAE